MLPRHSASKFATTVVVGIALLLAGIALYILNNSDLRKAASRRFLAIADRKRAGTARRELSSLEPIDAHTHISRTDPAFSTMLDRLHMHVLDILYVDDTNPNRKLLEPQKQEAMKFVDSAPGRAWLCSTFDPFQIGSPNFSERAVQLLDQDFQRGAVAVKVWKNIGMEIKNASGRYVMLDDPNLQPIYRDIASHNKTLITHTADPDAAWNRQYATAVSAKYFAANPQWDMSKQPDAPSKETILQARDHVLVNFPNLRVIGAHLGSMEGNLDELGSRLDRYPNFAVDTAARVLRLTVEPRERVRAFLIKYQDRVLYGTDLSFDAETQRSAEAEAIVWEEQYLLDWRYLATNDTFDYRGHTVEGLGLPRSVLEKLYHENAIRWIPGIDANAR
jgi:predicted TIM-barrel fold metal-dependent hydrolase